MQTQRIPKSRAAESAARNSAPTRTLKHWMMPYKICRDGRTAGGQPTFFSGEKLKKNVKKHRWTVAILLLHHPIFSHKKTQMLMSNSLAQTRGGLQYPNNNPVAAHVQMHTLNHHTLTTSSVECPPGLFRRFQHKLLRPKIVQHWAPIKRKAGYSYYRKPSSHSHLATTASSINWSQLLRYQRRSRHTPGTASLAVTVVAPHLPSPWTAPWPCARSGVAGSTALRTLDVAATAEPAPSFCWRGAPRPTKTGAVNPQNWWDARSIWGEVRTNHDRNPVVRQLSHIRTCYLGLFST